MASYEISKEFSTLVKKSLFKKDYTLNQKHPVLRITTKTHSSCFFLFFCLVPSLFTLLYSTSFYLCLFYFSLSFLFLRAFFYSFFPSFSSIASLRNLHHFVIPRHSADFSQTYDLRRFMANE